MSSLRSRRRAASRQLTKLVKRRLKDLTPEELTLAEEYIEWIETWLKYPEGDFVGEPFILDEFQKDFIYRVYDNEVPTRTAVLSIARKNAKTTLTAALMLLHLCGPAARPSTHCYSAARTRDQAGKVYNFAEKMVRSNPHLLEMIDLTTSKKFMKCPSLDTDYQALSSDATSALGHNPLFVIHDELGAVTTDKDALYRNIESGMVGNTDPLSIIISTQAAEDDHLLSMIIDRMEEHPKPEEVCVVYTAEGMVDKDGEPVEPVSVAGLREANPAWDTFINQKELLRDMQIALEQPSELAGFMNLNLNMRIDPKQEDVDYIPIEVWKACGQTDKYPDIWKDFDEIFGGLDLARVKDMAALILVGILNGKYYCFPTMWLPRDGLEARAKRMSIPLDTWHASGKLQTTPGPVIDFKVIAELLKGYHNTGKLKKVAVDPHLFGPFQEYLRLAGFTEWEMNPDVGNENSLVFQNFRQGWVSMDPAITTLERLALEKQLVHPEHPVMNHCWDSTRVKVLDENGNRRFKKRNRSCFIDGMIGLAMGVEIAKKYATEPIVVPEGNMAEAMIAAYKQLEQPSQTALI